MNTRLSANSKWLMTIVLSLATAMFLAGEWYVSSVTRPDSPHTITIQRTNVKNPLSRDAQVWVISLSMDTEGEIALRDYNNEGKATIDEGGRLGILEGGHEISHSGHFRKAHVTFLTHGWSGHARVLIDGREVISEDLYSESAGEKQFSPEIYRLPRPLRSGPIRFALALIGTAIVVVLVSFAPALMPGGSRIVSGPFFKRAGLVLMPLFLLWFSPILRIFGHETAADSVVRLSILLCLSVYAGFLFHDERGRVTVEDNGETFAWQPWAAFLVPLVFFSLIMPQKPDSDVLLIANTAGTIAQSGFREFHAFTYEIHGVPRLIVKDGMSYTFYPKGLEIFLGALAWIATRLTPALYAIVAGGLTALYLWRRRSVTGAVLLAIALAYMGLLHKAVLGVNGSEAYSVAVLLHVVLSALTILVAFRILHHLGASPAYTLVLLASTVFGSFFMYYSKAYHREAYYLCFFLLAIYFLLKCRYLPLGLVLGAVTLIKYQYVALVLPFFMLYSLWQYRAGKGGQGEHAGGWVWVLLVCGACFALDKYLMFRILGNSSPLEAFITLRRDLLTPGAIAHGLLTSLYGLTFSPGKGFFLFYPVGLLVFFLPFRRMKGNAEFVLFLTLALEFLVFHAMLAFTSNGWSGDWSWGPRYLTFVIFLCVFMLGMAGRRIRAYLMVLLILAGFAVNIPGSLMGAHSNIYYLLVRGVGFEEMYFKAIGNPTLVSYRLLWGLYLKKDFLYESMMAEAYSKVRPALERDDDERVRNAYEQAEEGGPYVLRDDLTAKERKRLIRIMKDAGAFDGLFSDITVKGLMKGAAG